MREHLLEPVMEAFLANGSKYNLLNSAVLELIDFIRKVCSCMHNAAAQPSARCRPSDCLYSCLLVSPMYAGFTSARHACSAALT